MKRIVVVVSFALIPQLLGCSFLFAKGVGSSSGITLLQPSSAKAAGMSEAYSSISGDITSISYNPAGLSSLDGQEASAMYQRGLVSDNFLTFLYGKSLPFATLATSILYYDTGEIELYDSSGELITKTGQRDIIWTVGLARELYGFPLGLNLKVISSEIFGEKALAYAIDVGAQYKGILDCVDAGFSIQNLGTRLTYQEEGESLPLIIRPGISYRRDIFGNPLLLSVDFPYYVYDQEILTLLGIEWTYKGLIAVRSGYRLNLTGTSKEDEPFSLGIGFVWKGYSLDYAIGITKNLSLPHRISLDRKF